MQIFLLQVSAASENYRGYLHNRAVTKYPEYLQPEEEQQVSSEELRISPAISIRERSPLSIETRLFRMLFGRHGASLEPAKGNRNIRDVQN
jgi:hypothetical protein